MHIVADRVFPDEPCHGLAEGPLIMPQPDGSYPWRWVQRVFVIRGDAIAKWCWDIGPAEDYEEDVAPVIVPSFGENTVAQLQEIAEHNRHDGRWARRRRELQEASTLREDALRIVEERYLQKRNRTTIGAGGMRQRGDYPARQVERSLRDRIKEVRHGSR